jgi:hypothetical protein
MSRRLFDILVYTPVDKRRHLPEATNTHETVELLLEKRGDLYVIRAETEAATKNLESL